MRQDDERQGERDFQSLKMRIVTAGLRPEQVPELLELLEGKTEEGEVPEFAEELSDEEMENYVPYSVEETDSAIEQLRRFGLAIT